MLNFNEGETFTNLNREQIEEIANYCNQNGLYLYCKDDTYEIKKDKSVNLDAYHDEIVNLKDWYNNYYSPHEQKYRRLHSLGKLTDEGANAYDNLIKLYHEAEIKRARIQELERLISDSSN